VTSPRQWLRLDDHSRTALQLFEACVWTCLQIARPVYPPACFGGQAVTAEEAVKDAEAIILSIPMNRTPGIAPLMATVPKDTVVIGRLELLSDAR
jgi:hypothetical protein